MEQIIKRNEKLIDEIVIGIQEISKAISILSDSGTNNSESVTAINELLKRFKVN